MSWFIRFLSSSIGRKIIMSLTGLFLILFLVIHLIGNLQLLIADQGRTFNEYAYMMTTNPVIKFTSYGLYFFILLHAIQGLVIWAKNRSATGKGYKVNKINKGTSIESRYMAQLGLLILVFLGIHMGDFWWAMKFGDTNLVTYEGLEVKDLYEKVNHSFSNIGIVIFYIISMLGLFLHLKHGFASAFQTLGLNHKKYTPTIQAIGLIYSIVIPLLFALIPILFYLGIQF